MGHLTLINHIKVEIEFNVSEELQFQGSKTGKDNGFTMLFDIESFDYSYFNEGSEGLKLALVHHLDMPIMRQKDRNSWGVNLTLGIYTIRRLIILDMKVEMFYLNSTSNFGILPAASIYIPVRSLL